MSHQFRRRLGKSKRRTPRPTQHIKLYDHAGLLPLIRASEDQIYSVVQTTADYTLSQAAITPQFLSFNFSLDQLAQYTSWTAVFDQYRIAEVQVIIRPMYNAQPLTSLATTRVPLLYTVIDYDDNINASTLAQLEEYSNCQISQYETTVATFRPHVAIASFDGSAFTSYANQAVQWIDAAYPAVKHFGLKMGCDGGISGQTNLQAWNINVRYKVLFKNIR